MNKGSVLLIAALVSESGGGIFGVSRQVNVDVVELLRQWSIIKLVLTRHERAVAFKVATHGWLTGHAGMCIGQRGP